MYKCLLKRYTFCTPKPKEKCRRGLEKKTKATNGFNNSFNNLRAMKVFFTDNNQISKKNLQATKFSILYQKQLILLFSLLQLQLL